ncbi:MAG: 50S ribosomal protein L10 [Acidobacteriota bacterium]|nr:50S ribosomal protein L10 [Acidobacteriota bacterium]
MKTRERKQEDLNALTEQLSNSKSAMVISFSKVTVNKDQELREQLRGAGANYQVVKNTIARLAIKGTPYETADEHFKGVSAIAWTDSDPVILSKTISKFVKDNGETFSFKVGIVDGKAVTFKQVEAIASLPSKEELISKLLFVINAQAQRIVTVINAVPRNLAIVIKQIGDAKPATAEQPAETKTEQPTAEASAATEEVAAAPQTDEQVPAQESTTAETTEQNTEETTAAPDASQEEPAAE